MVPDRIQKTIRSETKPALEPSGPAPQSQKRVLEKEPAPGAERSRTVYKAIRSETKAGPRAERSRTANAITRVLDKTEHTKQKYFVPNKKSAPGAK